MKHMHLMGCTALSLLLLSTSVSADVTPEQVWENWQSVGAASGQTYTVGSQNRSGDTLTLTDLTVASAPGDAAFSTTIPQVDFKDLGDGRVQIVTSPEYDLLFEMTGPSGAKSTNTMRISQAGMTMLASGDPAALNYEYSVDKLTVSADEFAPDDSGSSVAFAIALGTFKANYSVTEGDNGLVTSTLSAADLNFTAQGKGAQPDGSFNVTGTMTQLAGASSGTMMGATDMSSLPALLAKGFATEAAFTYGGGSMAIAGVDPNGTTTNINTSSQGGNLNFAIDKTRIAYRIGGKMVRIAGESSAMPLPDLFAAYDEASIDLLMPIAKSDEPADFVINTTLKGLTVSDVLWGMIDPAASLPRDPANLVIALRGKAKPTVDLIDESAMESAMSAGPPAEIHALDITALELSVAGAKLLGDGALTFDNSQPPLLGGMAPFPEGKINLSLAGANTLLGKLLSLGLIDPQVSMGFGMMSSMLARPGAEPDTLVSEIEFKGGQIFANGQPLPFGP